MSFAMSTRLCRVRLLPRAPIRPVLTPLTIYRQHGSHSHSKELLMGDKKDAGVRITRIGLGVNIAMALGKGVGGWYLGSQALVADGWHALTDTLSDIMTLATVSWSLKPPTAAFPNGFGKIESLGSVSVSGLLLVGGLLMGYSSSASLLAELGMLGSVAHHVPNLNAAWIAGGSVIVKEWLYRATMKIARERDSSLLASNAVHHRVDSLTSIVALVAIAGANLTPNATWLDPTGGLLVSLLVIKAGWQNTRASLLELADGSITAEMKGKVTALGKACDLNIVEVQGTKAGQTYLVDVAVTAPTEWTLKQCAAAEQKLRQTIAHELRGVKRLKVRFVSAEICSSFADEFIEPEEILHGDEHDDHRGHPHGPAR